MSDNANRARRNEAGPQRRPQKRPQQRPQGRPASDNRRRPENMPEASSKHSAKPSDVKKQLKEQKTETKTEEKNEVLKQLLDTEVTEMQYDTDYLSSILNEEPINTPRKKHNYPEVRRSNIPMILMLFIIVVFGLVVLYSVSGPQGYAMPNDKSSTYYLRRQLLYTVVGLVLCFTASFIPIKFFNRPIVWSMLYSVSLVSLILTKVVGYSLNGAKRWIKIGGFTFQASEMVKVALVIALAGYRSWVLDQRSKGKLKSRNPKSQKVTDVFFDFILPVGAAALCDVFIVIQPHFSCALIVAFVVFMCTLNSGVGLRSWFFGGLTLALFAILAVMLLFTFNPNYVRKNFAHVFQRFAIYEATHGDENSDVSADETRQVDNAHNALGSGGMWGVGLGNSRAKYDYVSEPQNDYIFSIYVEETGFVGGMLLILMYMVMFAMCFMVIMRADSIFSRMIATGCTSIIMIQVLLNIAVELQIAPSTGVTLPFVSYGGTAQVFLLTTYGMILCVSRSGTAPARKKEVTDGV